MMNEYERGYAMWRRERKMLEDENGNLRRRLAYAETLIEELEKQGAERLTIIEELKADLRDADMIECAHCAYREKNDGSCCRHCEDCDEDCPCKSCRDHDKWMWRGERHVQG